MTQSQNRSVKKAMLRGVLLDVSASTGFHNLVINMLLEAMQISDLEEPAI